MVVPHYTGSSSANDCPIDKLPRPWQCCDHQYTIYYIYYLYCVMWPSVYYLSDVDTLGTQDQALCAQAVLCCPIDQRRVSRVISGNGECCCSNHFCSYIILSKSKPPYTLYRILESELMIYWKTKPKMKILVLPPVLCCKTKPYIASDHLYCKYLIMSDGQYITASLGSQSYFACLQSVWPWIYISLQPLEWSTTHL